MRKVPSELGQWVFLGAEHTSSREALSVRVSHRFTAGSARFDEDNLVSYAGLVAVLGLAEQTRLPEIIDEKCRSRRRGSNPGRRTRNPSC
jgi:hypothetical protein